MGQKVNPIGLRLGVNKTWKSSGMSTREYATLHEDLKLQGALDLPRSRELKSPMLEIVANPSAFL